MAFRIPIEVVRSALEINSVATQERKMRDLEAEVARLRDKLAKVDLIIYDQKSFPTC